MVTVSLGIGVSEGVRVSVAVHSGGRVAKRGVIVAVA
jgi:hypothetical protein